MVRSTKTKLKYEALAWSWGAGPHNCRIRIREAGVDSKMRVALALVWALKYLAHSSQHRTLWVAAIRMDQSSAEEKSHQVQMMAQIYSYAGKAWVWLG